MQELAVLGFVNFRRAGVAALMLIASVAVWTGSQVALAQMPKETSGLGTPGKKHIFALVVGIDNYKMLPTLDGAVADARDIDRALRRGGVTDITLLIDSAATRAAVTDTMRRFVKETRPGDLVLISFAGHGSQEPARVKTADNGGVEESFMLAGFDEEGPATRERLLDREIFEWLYQLDNKGAAVVVVADSCHGGGLSKTVDPRIGRLSYRAVHRVNSKAEAGRPGTYYITNDQLEVSPAVGENTAGAELRRFTLIAAVDRNTESPEVRIQSEPTPRGAVSYAFARALEGMADTDHDGRLTRRELITYVRNKTSELTERGQQPTFEPLDRFDDVILTLGTGAPAELAARQPGAGTSSAFVVIAKPDAPPPISVVSKPSAVIRVGVLNGAVPSTSSNQTGAAFVLVPSDAGGLDAVWDAKTGDVVSSLGDIIARRTTPAQIPGVVDRLAAVRHLAALPQTGSGRLVLSPDKRTFRNSERTNLKIDGVDGRYLILANISGNGKIQFVYPLRGDDPMVMLPQQGAAKEIGEIVIGPPFGSEVVVAVASRHRLTALEQQLIRNHDQQGARQFIDFLSQLPPGEAEISFLSFFTEP
jgi:hypothetical protein